MLSAADRRKIFARLMLSRVELEKLLHEVEPTIHSVAVRTRRFDRCGSDVDDAKQHLRELVIRQSERFQESSQALRVCMLKAAAIARIRSERSAEARDVRYSEREAAPTSTTMPPAEKVMQASASLDRICLALANLSGAELKAFTDRLDGESSAVTAEQLGVSDETVRYYRSRILDKLASALKDDEGSHQDVSALIEALHADYG